MHKTMHASSIRHMKCRLNASTASFAASVIASAVVRAYALAISWEFTYTPNTLRRKRRVQVPASTSVRPSFLQPPGAIEGGERAEKERKKQRRWALYSGITPW